MSRWHVGALVAIYLATLSTANAEMKEKWIAYYNGNLPAEAFRDFDVIAFDRESHPRLDVLRDRKRVILGYISLGEAESYRSDFRNIKAMGLLIRENRNWRGHWIVDLRNDKWIEHVANTIVPDVIRRGFDGIVLDTLDSPLELEANNPVQFKGMTEAAINAVRLLRTRFPELKIMLNRGFKVLPEVAPYIDFVLAENLNTDWTIGQKPRLTAKRDASRWLRSIMIALAKDPRLKVYTLDYWPASDVNVVKNIYREMRSLGFIPYVGAIELDTIQPEPL